MKRRKRLFVLICTVGFITLLAVYALALLDIVMPKSEKYVDPNNGISVVLPSGWSFYDNRETTIRGVQLSGFEKWGDFKVSYKWMDYWTKHEMDVPRSEVDNSYLTQLNLLTMSNSTGRYITVNGIEYFLVQYPFSDTNVMVAYYIHDGILYKFDSSIDNIIEQHEFFRFLKAVQYPETWSNYTLPDSSETSAFTTLLEDDITDLMRDYLYQGDVTKAAKQSGTIINWINAAIILVLFLIPLIISRSALRKHRMNTKNALITTLIITLASAVAIAFMAFWCGLSLWLTLEAVALGLITYKTITGEKMLFADEQMDS